MATSSLNLQSNVSTFTISLIIPAPSHHMSDKQPPDDLIWGRRPVLEALRAERPLRRLLVAKGAHGPVIDEIFARARQAPHPL